MIHKLYYLAALAVVFLPGCAALSPTPKSTPELPPQSPPPVPVVVEPGPSVPTVITEPLAVPVPTKPVLIEPTPKILGAPESLPADTVDPATTESPVVVSLLAQADQQSQQGEQGRAAAAIERGLRIEPRNARLWSKLAQIRLEQKRPQQAESLAKKSNRFARGDRMLLAKNWQIIATARKQNGNTQGAAEAIKKAELYQ